MAPTERASLAFLAPIGRLRVTASRDHLLEVKLRAPELPDSLGDAAAADLCRRARQEIEDYLAGRLERFTVPWRLAGDGLKRRVLHEMARIPYARTVTYGELARSSGEGTGASRVVGAICGANPLPLVIPCHRVLAGDGLGGFGGGLAMKRWLLQLEITGKAPLPLAADGSARVEVAEEPPAGVQLGLFGNQGA